MGKEEKKQRVANWNQVVIPDRVKERAHERWEPDGDCWISTYSTGSHGYAQIGWGVQGKSHIVLAHRASWEHVNGPVPQGMTIDHLCKQRQCVNPAHHRVLPNYENARRTGGRDWPLGECVNGHSNDHLKEYDGRRHCSICVTTIWGTGATSHRQLATGNIHRKMTRPPAAKPERRERRPRQAGKGSTHCLHGHERTPENTYDRPNGTTQCRDCRSEQARKRNPSISAINMAAFDSVRKSLDLLMAADLNAEQQQALADLANAMQDMNLQWGKKAA